MPFTPPVDGPPPSPATDPAAAREVGKPSPMSASNLASPISMAGGGSAPGGPDLSGILTLGEKVEQGMLSIMQAVPPIAPKVEAAKNLFMDALAEFVSTSGKSNGSMPGAAPRGQVVTQAGAQFPGGGQTGGRPF